MQMAAIIDRALIASLKAMDIPQDAAHVIHAGEEIKMVFFGKLYESVKGAVKSAFGYSNTVSAEKTESYARVTAPVYSHASVNGNGNGNGNRHSTPLYRPKPNGNRLERVAK